MIDPWTSAVATAALVRQGAVSAVAVDRGGAGRIAAEDGRLNSFTTVTAERALAEAAAVDAARAARRRPAAAGRRALCGQEPVRPRRAWSPSPARRSSATGRPPRRDAFLVERMRAAGAVCVGALNMDEYAYGFTTENAHDGPCHNPHDLGALGRRLVGRLRCLRRRRPGAALARQRHQRLDPGAGQPVRHLRPEADLRPAGAHRHLPVRRRASTIWARSPATWPTSPPPGTRCRASDPADPAQGRWPVEAATPVLRAGHRRAADRRRRRPLRAQRPCRGVRRRGDRGRCAGRRARASPCPRRRAAGPRPS